MSVIAASLGEFLRSRRERVSPAQAGLFAGRRRRVPGLRREEVAGLAGLSTDYYARLEQGRHAEPSPGVVDALARVLLLDDGEHAYLRRLAGSAPEPAPVRSVRPATLRVMAALGTTPAFVLGPAFDLLASNRAGRLLYADFDAMPRPDRNVLRWMLTEPAKALFGAEWSPIVAEMVGLFRRREGDPPRDPAAAGLVAELCRTSDFFRTVWADRTVVDGSRPIKRFRHALAGPLDMTVETLEIPQAPGQRLVVMTPDDERAWAGLVGRAGPDVTAIPDLPGRG
ncbi:MAG TPA: helix-turn-helix transcriptional regulator [Actinoplanes sp.]|nr:helix-turn-helix transcriptional regulator [Actinoplanes sp.]